mgnify:FL=1
MNDLLVDVDVIERMRTGLSRVKREFENANENSNDAADAVGHHGLAERVRGFAHNWDNRRGELVAQITHIEDHLDNIQEQFDIIDTELKDGLSGNAATSTGSRSVAGAV